ncbi:MAG: hypothetical protein RL348_1046, partial [Bacteroidota bacterium]
MLGKIKAPLLSKDPIKPVNTSNENIGRDFSKEMLGLGRLSYFIVLIIAKETIAM